MEESLNLESRETLSFLDYINSIIRFEEKKKTTPTFIDALWKIRRTDSTRLTFDPFFWQYLQYSIFRPSMGSTHTALESLLLLKKKALISKSKKRILGFLDGCLDPQTLIFRNGYKVKFPPSIYSLHSAIGVIKSLMGIKCEVPLGEKIFTKVMKDIREESSPIDRVIEFLKRQRFEKSMANTSQQNVPTTVATYMCVCILWNLGIGEEIFKIIKKDALLKFVRSCYRERPSFGHAGFTLSRNQEVPPCICTTYFVIKLEEKLGMKIVENKDEKRKIVKFIMDCWKEGGFSPTPDDSPSLNSTFFALKVLAYLDSKNFREFQESHRDDIIEFIKRCHMMKGFTFSEGYPENIFATRYAIQILKEIGNEGDLVVKEVTNDIVKFCMEKLYDRTTGGFYGFDRARLLPQNLYRKKKLINELKRISKEIKMEQEKENKYRDKKQDEETLSPIELSIMTFVENHGRPCSIEYIAKSNIMPKKIVQEIVSDLKRKGYDLEEMGYIKKRK